MVDEDFMQRAIELAYHGNGYVSPNPMVGAVLVHNDRIIGEGFHAFYGDVHAEVDCFRHVAAADIPLIRQSTMYVTLEPCTHRGKQPPCAHRLIQERIKHVVIAMQDPFPAVSGKGIEMLREAGIEVRVGTCNEAARWMCRRFLNVQENNRPYVVLKWAESADGYMAPADGTRLQLSNIFSQAMVHKWRTEESAIMVGYNTALTDNPRLTSRYWKGPQPLRIVLDETLKLPEAHHLLDNSTPTWIVNERKETEGMTRHLQLKFDDNLLPDLMQQLKKAGKNSLLVEGGAKLLNNFIAAGLWDEARVFKTKKMIGLGLAAPLLTHAKHSLETMVGDDTLHLYQREGNTFPYINGAAF